VGAIDRLLAVRAPAAGVSYLDLGPELVGPGDRFIPGVMSADLLHPATGGYDRMAAKLAPTVRRLLGGPSA
jgi:lysophospholipase L1-like esterase